MAEAGVGVDLVEIDRMEQLIAENPELLSEAFSDEERSFCENSHRTIASYAGRMAAHEAVLKALGCSDSDEAKPSDVSVSVGERGRPVVNLSGRAAEVAHERGIIEVALSLSLTKELAVANAMAITEDARPKPKEDKLSEKAKIARSFKEVRSVLDDLERVQDLDTDVIEAADAAADSNRSDDEASS